MKASVLKENKQSVKPLTTFEREMQDPEFKKSYEIGYQQFCLNEIMHQLMQEKGMSEDELINTAEITPQVFHDIRDGEESVTVHDMIKVIHTLGAKLVVEAGGKIYR